jgi:hypothetical protein
MTAEERRPWRRPTPARSLGRTPARRSRARSLYLLETDFVTGETIRVDGGRHGPTLVSGEYDLFGLAHRLDALVAQTGARALVLDSATALFSPRPPQETLRSHFFQLVHTLRQLGLTSVITAEAPADYGQLTTMGVEDYVCDLTIILRNIVDGVQKLTPDEADRAETLRRRRRTDRAWPYLRLLHSRGIRLDTRPGDRPLQLLTIVLSTISRYWTDGREFAPIAPGRAGERPVAWMAESTVGGGSMGAPWFERDPREVFNRASLLLVEDDPDIRELVVTLLELAGFEVTACGSAELALEGFGEELMARRPRPSRAN